MTGAERFDLVVIGAGAAGLTAAGGAAMFGLKVALIEAGEMGGECLNTGCVPSKALLAAAARAQGARGGSRLGVSLPPPEVDFVAVRDHVRGAIAAIAPHDSQERFETLGVDVIRTRARFLDGKTVLVGNRRLTAPRIVVATGSKPRIPDVPGLADLPPLTNENLFELDVLPRHLLVLGAGAVGVEMAQAFRRLGAEVTVVAPHPPLGRDDAKAAALVVDALRAEGVTFEIGREAVRAARACDEVELTLDDGRTLSGSHLLVAAGRVANVADLDLGAAGIEVGDDGIVVDARRRTTNKRVYAIGDCRAGPRFTHVSGYEGALVAVDVALGVPGKVDWRALPRVTYTDPELAQIGLTEAEARQRFGEIEVVRQGFDHNDRAVAEGDTRGFLKLVRRRGRVLGVTIVGAHAGELLTPWSQVITGKASSFALGSAIVAYPTRSEIAKAAAFAAHERLVFGPLAETLGAAGRGCPELAAVSGWWDGLLAIGRDHGVDPLVFAAIYVGGIPFFLLSVAWLVRRRRAGRSTVVPTLAAGLCLCSAYIYLGVVGRDIPAWVWGLLGLMVAYGAWSAVRNIRRKLRLPDRS